LNDETAAKPDSRVGVHLTMVSTWKRRMRDGAADIDKKKGVGRRSSRWLPTNSDGPCRGWDMLQKVLPPMT
jgi:hypothetical protein